MGGYIQHSALTSGVGDAPTHSGFSLRKLAFEILSPVCNVRKYPKVAIPVLFDFHPSD